MEGSICNREDISVPNMRITQDNKKGVGVSCYECEVYDFWSMPTFVRPDTDRRPTCKGCVKLKEGVR